MQHQLFGLSPYVYVRNNPINRFDPDGFVDWGQVILGGLSVIGGVSTTITGGAIAVSTGVTVVGAVGGVALMTHGLATAGFGVAKIIAGFQDNGTEVSGGPLEALGKEVSKQTGNDIYEKTGAIADGLVGAGNPLKNLKNAGNALPTSAKEAKAAAGYQKTVTKELTELVSKSSSNTQVIMNSKDVIKKVVDDEDNDK